MHTVEEQFPLRRSSREVLDLLADRGFIERRTAANASMAGEVLSHERVGDRLVITTRAQVPTDWLPERVATRVASRPSVTRTETWSLQRGDGTMEFRIDGVPASASGSMRLTDRGDGSLLAQLVDVGVDVPFVGRLVERAVGGQIARSLGAEARCYDV